MLQVSTLSDTEGYDLKDDEPFIFGLWKICGDGLAKSEVIMNGDDEESDWESKVNDSCYKYETIWASIRAFLSAWLFWMSKSIYFSSGFESQDTCLLSWQSSCWSKGETWRICANEIKVEMSYTTVVLEIHENNFSFTLLGKQIIVSSRSKTFFQLQWGDW